jgi:hypothetical protein
VSGVSGKPQDEEGFETSSEMRREPIGGAGPPRRLIRIPCLLVAALLIVAVILLVLYLITR